MARDIAFACGSMLALVALAACQTNGRIDDLNQRIDSLDERLTKIEASVADSDNVWDPRQDSSSMVNTESVVMEVTVGPRLIDCVGAMPMKCLEVDGQLFYDTIQGFDHEEGYTFRLKIERYDAFPGEQQPPQDASRYGYRLIEIVSRTAP